MSKRKIRIVWSCSDFVHHEHRTKGGAWLCGRVQMVWHSSLLPILRMAREWFEVEVLPIFRRS